MGKKRGRNEDIHIGDIFRCYENQILIDKHPPEYYQVVALRGKTRVELRAIRSETCIKEGGGPLREEQTRPLPGQFMTVDEMDVVYQYWDRGRWVRITGDRVTAWVLPYRTAEGRPLLQEVGELQRRLGVHCALTYALTSRVDWELWGGKRTAKREKRTRTCTERACGRQKGEGDPP